MVYFCIIKRVNGGSPKCGNARLGRFSYVCFMYITVWQSMQSVGENRTQAHCLCARKSTWCIKLLLSPLLLRRQLCLLQQHIFLMKILRFNFSYRSLVLTTNPVAFDARSYAQNPFQTYHAHSLTESTQFGCSHSCPAPYSSCGSDSFAGLTFQATTEMIVIFWRHKIWRLRCGHNENQGATGKRSEAAVVLYDLHNSVAIFL